MPSILILTVAAGLYLAGVWTGAETDVGAAIADLIGWIGAGLGVMVGTLAGYLSTVRERL